MSNAYSRGDIIVTVLSADYGKPRPALVIQSDLFNPTHASLVLCPISSDLTGFHTFRIPLTAGRETGLRVESEVMIDKMSAVRRDKIRRRIGHVSDLEMAAVERALRVWLSLSSKAS